MSKMIKELVENYFVQGEIMLALKKYMITKYNYDCASRSAESKPEYVFQDDIVRFLESIKCNVEAPFVIKTEDEQIKHTLKEKQFQYDLGIYANGHRLCIVELKYDEVKADGTSTNPHSEDQIKRDLYKLEKWKDKHPEEACYVVFATNKESYWKNFTNIDNGDYEIEYDGKTEKFKLSHSYSWEWKRSYKNCSYRFCVIEVKQKND